MNKQKITRIITCLMMLIMVFALTACGKIKNITIEQDSLTLTQGDSYHLIATTDPGDADTEKLVWKSSNPDAVIVDNEGYVYAVFEGVATITCSADDVSDSCDVFVLSEYDALYFSLTDDERAIIDNIDYALDIQYGKKYDPETNKILAIWSLKAEPGYQKFEILFDGKYHISDLEVYWSESGVRGVKSGIWHLNVPETTDFDLEAINTILKLKYS